MKSPAALATSTRAIASREAGAQNRALDWLCLLPRDTGLRLDASIPDSLAPLFRERLDATGETLVACRRLDAVARAGDFQSLVVVNPERGLATELRQWGFPHTLGFVALPSLAQPRVVLPLDSRAAGLGGLDLLAPYQRDARIKKLAMGWLARCGLADRAGDAFLLARRAKSDLERCLEAVTGQEPLHLALAPGAEGEFRKLTMRLMNERGQAVGFAKLAMTAAARDAIERESTMLRTLARYPELSGLVPTLLGAGYAGEQLFNVQSPGAGRPSGADFDARHAAFLDTLAMASTRRIPFSRSTMWRSMQTSFRLIAPRRSRPWVEQVSAALVKVERSLRDVDLPLSIAHRDFGPWNVRIQRDGRLFVYDWEAAQPEMTPLYDFFDFHVRAHILLGRQGVAPELARAWLSAAEAWFPRTPPALVPRLFRAYLVDRILTRTRYVLWRGDENDALLALLWELLGVGNR